MDWISFAGAKRLETTADISSKEKTDKKKDLKAYRHTNLQGTIWTYISFDNPFELIADISAENKTNCTTGNMNQHFSVEGFGSFECR